jgi:hypothetical protein
MVGHSELNTSPFKMGKTSPRIPSAVRIHLPFCMSRIERRASRKHQPILAPHCGTRWSLIDQIETEWVLKIRDIDWGVEICLN